MKKTSRGTLIAQAWLLTCLEEGKTFGQYLEGCYYQRIKPLEAFSTFVEARKRFDAQMERANARAN